MKIVTITGNHLRHNYLINSISKEMNLSASVVVGREAISPKPPEGISKIDKENFFKHFFIRGQTEKHFFSDDKNIILNDILKINPDELNSMKTADFISKFNPDLVLIFGVGLIKEPLLNILPKETINMHGGLSPRYRGSATLFWPFYFLEPAFAGLTFHYITSEPDAGDIIHQVTPKLNKGDGIHDVACKAVVEGAIELLELITILDQKGKLVSKKQKGTGKNFLASDFKVEHLRLIYNTFNNDIVDYFLDGKISKKTPKLIRQY